MFPLWNFFLAKRQFSTLLLVGLVVWGISLAILIRKESAPEVQIPVGVVTTLLPGASAEEVEKLVTNKLEERLANLQNLSKLTSTSRESVSSIVVEFTASADLDESIQKLKDEVDKAKVDLPEAAEDPAVSDVNFVDQPVLIATLSADLPFGAFATLGEQVKSELQSISGVSRVDVQGTRDPEVQVVVRKEDLASYGLSIDAVVQAIRAANASLPVGSLTINDIEYSVRFEGDLKDPSEVTNIPLVTPSGVILYLRDIASVSDGVAEATTLTRLSVDGAPSEQALTLNVFKSRGADVTSVASDVREKLAEMQQGLLAGSELVIAFDSGDLVEKDLGSLTETGVITVILVVGVLLLTIGWREALIAGLSVPLSFILSFIGLFYSGNTINFVSLFSLILAIGILVDAGIVVLEAMAVRMRRHGDATKAAQDTIKEFSWPLIAGTVTTIAVFVPLFFISGVVGKFIASIPFTIIAVLIASLVVALGMLPFIAASLISVKKSRFNEIQDRYSDIARARYEAFLRRIFANRRFQKRFLWGLTALFVLSLSLPIIGLVRVEFFPAEDADFIYLNLEMPEGTTLARTDLAMRAVEEVLYEIPDAASVVTTIGASNQFSGEGGSGAKYANALIIFPEKSKRLRASSAVVADIRARTASFNQGTVRVGEPAGGPPVGAPILVKFLGTDRAALEASADEARRILEGIEGVIDIETSGENDGIEFTLLVDRGKLAELGLTPIAIAQTLRTAVFGTEATDIKTDTKDIAIIVRANLNTETRDPHRATVATIDAIKQIPIRTTQGDVLLGSLIEPTLTKSSTSITHEGRKRIVSVTANVKDGYNVISLTGEFTKAAEAIKLPQGVSMQIGGENEETNKSFMEMGFAFIAGIVLMFAVVVLEFNSFRLASYTLLTVPLSLIGVFLGLALMQKPLSFPSLLGVIALGGVIINHSIILIDAFISPIRKHEDASFSLEEHVVKAAASRLRPIFLTTITTVIGMVPLSLASGLWAPLAFTIMFGLLFATVLTLILIPILLFRSPGKAVRAMVKEQK